MKAAASLYWDLVLMSDIVLWALILVITGVAMAGWCLYFFLLAEQLHTLKRAKQWQEEAEASRREVALSGIFDYEARERLRKKKKSKS